MPRPRNPDPKYCLHKASGLAFVRLGGRQFWLGKFGTPESRDKYQVIKAEWIKQGRPVYTSTGPRTADPLAAPKEAAGPKPASPIPHDITIAEVIEPYWAWAQDYYKSDPMRSTGEIPCIKSALRILNRFYGDTPAATFGPVKLEALRDEMAKPTKVKVWRKVPDESGKLVRKQVEVERPGWCRKFINAQVNRIRRMFKWAAAKELLPASVHAQLATLAGLKKGKTDARETAKVKPADEEAVAAAVLLLPPPVKTIVELCAVTGMRPGEARVMRTGDIDRTVNPWVYRPRYHKTEHRGEDHQRVILLGPQAQEILTPWLKLDPAAYLFRPADAMAWLWERRRKERKSPMTPSQTARAERARARAEARAAKLKPYYDKNALNRAVWRACVRAGLAEDRFTPNQLRHLVATRVRREYGLEAAQAVLGHQRMDITEVYAEKQMQKASDVMNKIG